MSSHLEAEICAEAVCTEGCGQSLGTQREKEKREIWKRWRYLAVKYNTSPASPINTHTRRASIANLSRQHRILTGESRTPDLPEVRLNSFHSDPNKKQLISYNLCAIAFFLFLAASLSRAVCANLTDEIPGRPPPDIPVVSSTEACNHTTTIAVTQRRPLWKVNTCTKMPWLLTQEENRL